MNQSTNPFDHEDLEDLPPVWDDLKNILQDMKMSRMTNDTVGLKDAITRLELWRDSNPDEAMAITRSMTEDQPCHH
ncbi:MAG: hypothetical protein ACTSPB_13675 [Candidatus Thorarchaeota archaeon]